MGIIWIRKTKEETMTPHIEAKKEEIADFVLMPGDPLRAKYIADNFLEDVIQVNSIRNMIAFTGSYKGKRITVFPSGMGIPSMGIYSYELFKFYDVQTILRLGSCGALTTDLDLLDTVLVDSTFSESNYALSMCNVQEHVAQASVELNKKILETSNKIDIPVVLGNILTNEFFDLYAEDIEEVKARCPQEMHIIASEMEAFALFYNAKYFNRNAGCMLTVVDSKKTSQSLSPDARQTSLNDMIRLALETSLKY